MKRLLLLFCIATLSASRTLGAGDISPELTALAERLTAFGKTIPQEKVYVQMDNTNYFQGDTIWFSAFTRQTNTGMPSTVSEVLYVELFSQEGYLMERKLIHMKDGRGNGFFSLDYPVQYSGFYELRAYTRWQLNWGRVAHPHSTLANRWFVDEESRNLYFRDYEKLYSRVFPVYDKPSKPGDFDRTMSMRPMRRYYGKDTDHRKLQLHIYPEGGNLIEGIPQRVAYEAVWNDGTAAEGYLQVGTDKVPVQNRGRGCLMLPARKAEVGKLVFVEQTGESVTAELPKTEAEGVVLTMEHKGGEWTVTYQLTEGLSPDSLALTVMHEGNLLDFRTLEGRKGMCSFSDSKLKPGVQQVTLFDTQGRIFADRLFFVRKQEMEQPLLSVSGLTGTYDPFAPIELEVSSTSAAEETISLSVRDGIQEEKLYDNAGIMGEMLLCSELKGFIPDPEWYFRKDDEEHNQALDLLMMTQGWRRFNWREMAVRGQWELSQPSERAPLIFGRVENNRWSAQEIISLSLGFTHQEIKEHIDPLRDCMINYDNLPDSSTSDRLRLINSMVNSYKSKGRKVSNAFVHAELVHLNSSESAELETTTSADGHFRLQLPAYYGDGIFFIGSTDSSQKAREKKTWIQLEDFRDYDDLTIRERIKSQKGKNGYTVRLDFPYPRFVKPYTTYQSHVRAISPADSILFSGTDVMNLREVRVATAHPRLNAYVDTNPAMVMDAYTAINNAIDAGLDLADNPVVRYLVSDYGLKRPYTSQGDNGIGDNNIHIRYGLNRMNRSTLPTPIPEDSVYHTKYLKSYSYPDATIHDNVSADWMESYMGLAYHDRYYLYTDYQPRMEGDDRYASPDLVDTHITIYPFPDGSVRATYVDRRYVLPGFAIPEECYSPDYSTHKLPEGAHDCRRTLYWNPEVRLDGEGKARVRFYNCERKTHPLVESAGLTHDGRYLWNKGQ